ncbi:MAG: hypothetical protein JO263_04960 [Candidatus Eremiobacteraeota bacterium]|nr:hypothetical protein [Candidatus Eremiobacteraeota bacterium]
MVPMQDKDGRVVGLVKVQDTVWFDETALPRCFVLNELHHVILACSPHPKDPLNAKFMPKAHANRLPTQLDRLVHLLEDACVREQCDSKSAVLGSVYVGAIRINVTPLHGPWGNHTNVMIERAA